ncbi:MAG TPA: hypothetical protein VKY59_18895 [Spirillospora sp.]|nr:hypothetical protein [Spirillospora sp.]
MSELLDVGEQQLGRYKVRFTRFVGGRWRTRGPWLQLIVTNRRLIILPDEARDGRTPLVISAVDIARVWSIGLGRRDGGVIALRTGEPLYFYVDWSQSARLIRDIRRMMQPAAAAVARSG